MSFDFTVIIPTCNRFDQLLSCLYAVSNQSFPRNRFEVVVVDDGSREPIDLRGLVFPMEVTIIRQPNQGPAAARNRGAAIARGRFLAFTDDDCVPDPAWLSSLFSILSEDPDCLVGGQVQNGLPENPYASASQVILEIAYAFVHNTPNRNRFYATNNLAVSRGRFLSLGGFQNTFRASEDRDFCNRWILSGSRLQNMPEAVVHHRHHLSLLSFIRQHAGYGRGAWKFFQAHSSRVTGSTLKWGFYPFILASLPAHTRGMTLQRAVGLITLLGIWQVSNLAGFLWEGGTAWTRKVERKTNEIR